MSFKDQEFQHLESSYLISQTKANVNVSVLRHLERPLEILDGEENYLQLNQPVCYYAAKLNILPEKLFPTHQNTKKLPIQQTKLISMENAELQFKQAKRLYEKSRFKTEILNQESQENAQQKNYIAKTKTLYNLFFLKAPYYCRLENHNMTKNNFANMFLNVAGVNLEAKFCNKLSMASNNFKKFPKLGQNEKRFNTGSLIFDSNFESGNLLYVFQTPSQRDQDSPSSYQLILHNDTNTYGHNQWFFFRVQSLKPHSTVKFTILNLIKNDSLFNYGLKPLVYSQKQSLTKNIGWLRRGENVRYYQNEIRRQNKKENYYTLEFEYTFKETKDWVYFCPSYPYTYTQMTTCVQQLYQEPLYKRCFSIKTLSQTLGKNKLNLITISTGKKMIQECKVVWILARQHPAQTTSSYMVEGILQYLLSLISEAKSDLQSKNKTLQKLHDYVFKIVPMVNVDGVIHGNSRAQLIGLDPNRAWKKPRKIINPDTYHILKQIMSYKNNVSMVLDLHSHSKKTGCFFYGNQIQSNSKLCKIYPSLICENDSRFSLKNCRFHGGYNTTARHILFQQLKIENIFTVECSLLGYLHPTSNRIIQYTIQDYHEMGAKLIQNYFKLQKIRLEKKLSQIIDEFACKLDTMCEVDSAKSDSSVSDDEYEEIRELERRLVKKKIGEKNRGRSVGGKNKKEEGQEKKQNKRRACSFVGKDNHTKQLVEKLVKIQTKNNIKSKQTNINSKLLQRCRNRCTTITSNTNKQPPYLQPEQQNSLIVKPNIIPQPHTPSQSKLRRSYMKYLSNSKIFNEYMSSKSKTQQHTFNKNLNGKDFAIQVNVAACLAGQSNTKRGVMLQSDSNLTTSFQHTKMRPLILVGNPCQNEFSLHSKNEVSIQTCVNQSPHEDLLKKQHKAIAKLPKLMNLISLCKMKKFSTKSNAYKENHLPATRYVDTKSLLYEEKNRKAINDKSMHLEKGINFRSKND